MRVTSKKDIQGFIIATEDGKFEFELFALTELTYLSARHINEAEADGKFGHEVICYFDRKDGKKDEFVTYLPYEYVDTHSDADVKDTIRNIRRMIVGMSAKQELTKVIKRYKVHVDFDNGDKTDCRVSAYSRGQAISRLFRNEEFVKYWGDLNVSRVEIEREESKKEAICELYSVHGNTYIKHLTFPRMTCEVTFDTDSDLKVMQIDKRDEAKATPLDYATAMREMGEYLVKHGKK